MILVDAFWLLHKCRHSLDFLKTSRGIPTGMEYGFLKSCEALERDFKDKVILCWESRSFRYDLYPEYKSGRVSKLDMDRVKEFKNFCKQVFRNAEHEGMEADDIIASLCGKEKTIIYANDKDLLQLIDEQTVVVKSFYDKKYPWDLETVQVRMYGLVPSELPLYQAWIGDPVDSIPGSGLRKSRIASAIIWSRDATFQSWPLWNAKELLILEIFVPRTDLTTLRRGDVQIEEAIWNKTIIEEWLVKMEIASLKMCGKIGMFKMEEF